MERINAYSDIVVKYLLGREESKDSLLSFINAVLSDSGFNTIASVSIKNPFSIKEFTTDKYCILDIKAEDYTGRQYDIEVQSSGNKIYTNRSLYYWARLYSSQIEEANYYKSLKPVVCINLLNFSLIENTNQYHTCYWITEKNDPALLLTDHLILHFLELPKITEDARTSAIETWLQYFLHEGRGDETMETILKDNPALLKVHDDYKRFTADAKMRELYEARLKWQLDYNQRIYDAQEEGFAKGMEIGIEQGIEKGIEKGIEQGIEKGKLDMAVNMLKNGLSLQDTSRYTGLSEDVLNNLDI